MPSIKNIFVFLAVFLLWFWASFTDSDAAIINAASPSYSDVSAAVSAAQSGDTVIVPAGSATWNNQLVIRKGITLRGAGAARTLIISNYVATNPGRPSAIGNFLLAYIPATPSLNEPFRITGFTFDLNNKCGGIMLSNESITPINRIRIDSNIIKNATHSGGTMRAIMINGTVYGVIHSNEFSGNAKHIDSYGMNAEAWSNLTFGFGGPNCMYYEDNIFMITNTPHSGGAGGRYCSRYNTYIHTASRGLYPWYDAHGNQPGANHATMGIEIYGNLLIHSYPTAGVRLMDHRGGKGVVHHNSVTATSSVDGACREEYDDSLNPPATGPEGQPQHVSDSYYWHNRKNYVTLVTFSETQDCCDAIAENSEFWVMRSGIFDGTGNADAGGGVGCGTLGNRPSTCTKGVAYWATNQSCSDLTGMVGANPATLIQGTLYKCTAPNTWKAYYSPYTYPHPLRQESRPNPPTGLKIIQ